MPWPRHCSSWTEGDQTGEFAIPCFRPLPQQGASSSSPRAMSLCFRPGYTPVDFATPCTGSARTISARVNGQLNPTESTLDSSDLVGGLFASRPRGRRTVHCEAGYVKSPRAHNKIRAWFSKRRRDRGAIEQNRDAIVRACASEPPISGCWRRLAGHPHEMRYPDSPRSRGDRRAMSPAQSSGCGSSRRSAARPAAGTSSRPPAHPPPSAAPASIGRGGQGASRDVWVRSWPPAAVPPIAQRYHHRLRHPRQL